MDALEEELSNARDRVSSLKRECAGLDLAVQVCPFRSQPCLAKNLLRP